MRRRSFIATLPLAAASPALAQDSARAGAPLQGAADVAQRWIDIAAAPGVDLAAAGSRNVRVTGKAEISDFGQAADGLTRLVRFTDDVLLVHDPKRLILPNGGHDLLAAADDVISAVSLGGGRWIVAAYQPASVTAKLDRRRSHGGLKFRYAIGADLQTSAPDFAVDGAYERTKVVAKSLFLNDPGDTPEIGLFIAGGTAAAPTAWTPPYPGAFVYGWPRDNTGRMGAQMGPGFGDAQWLGRNAQISFTISEPPTPTARGGALVFGVCPNGRQVPVDRGWFGQRGGFVLSGRALENALDAKAVPYPWNRVAIPSKYHPVPKLNWYDYRDDATLTLIASDTADNKVLSVRRWDDLGRGAGFDYVAATDEFRLGRAAGGLFKASWSWTARGDMTPAADRGADLGAPDRRVGAVHAGHVDVQRASTGPAAVFGSAAPDLSGDLVTLTAGGAAGRDFNFLRAVAGPDEDAALEIDGAGHAMLAGGVTGQGAGSGAYLEWADGNPEREDRVGWSVALEAGRIRRARSDDPARAVIGVVTARPNVVANAAWSHWSGKYLTDDFGRPLTRAVEHLRWSEPVTQTHQVERTRTVMAVVQRPRMRQVEAVEPAPRLEKVGDIWVSRPGEDRRLIERPVTETVWVHGEDGVPCLDACGRPVMAEVPVHDEAEEERTERYHEAVTVEVGRAEHCYPIGAVPAGVKVPAAAERVVLRQKLLNPAYDPAAAYAARAERPEWDVVSFSGPERLRQGEPVGDRWIRLRETAPGVEEWLVR